LAPRSQDPTAAIATKGADFAVADIGVCSDNGGRYSVSDFLIADNKNRTYSFWWLTFELPPGTKIKAVDYSPVRGKPLLWVLKK
jgi:uncharacterized protein YbdZ (MbtH family)